MNKVGVTNDKPRGIFRIVLAIIALSAGISVWADPGDTISATIRVVKPIKLGNTQLAAGEYKVTADGAEATFLQGKKVVAKVPCTLKDISPTPTTTMFIGDGEGRIIEIQVKGSTKAIEFSP